MAISPYCPGAIARAACVLVTFIIVLPGVYGGDVLIVEGVVRPDSTLSSSAGWKVKLYSYQEPPQEMSYLPPLGHEIGESLCDAEGRYAFQLSVGDLLAKGITKIVVFAHPNPSGGAGWQVLEVREGTHVVNLTASNLPALPSNTTSTQNIASSASSISSKSTDATQQTAIPGFVAESILCGLIAGISMLAFRRSRREIESH